jgi:hypothetical protein
MLPIFNHGVQGGGKVEYSMEEGGGFNFFNMVYHHGHHHKKNFPLAPDQERCHSG